MKLGHPESELDSIDLQILRLLQQNCKASWGKIGEEVGLSAPSVIERVKKLEESGVVRSYQAILDARALGLDVTAFIGVLIAQPTSIQAVEQRVTELREVLECHHVTGDYTLLVKVKTRNTQSLEELIRHLRSIEGVARTVTMVVLSTHTGRVAIDLPPAELTVVRRPRRANGRDASEAK
jgi:Lrp/AsnC family transcriptional regulator, leucine-responsive regulatory protein